MQIELSRRITPQEWQLQGPPLAGSAQWVLYVGPSDVLADATVARELARRHPQALVTGCSTGTSLLGGELGDGEVVAAALHFEGSQVRAAMAPLHSGSASRACGEQLAASLAAPDLALVVVLSEGSAVNGSDLLAGLAGRLGAAVPIVGGLAGDGDRFQTTLVGMGDAVGTQQVVAVGLYGRRVRHQASAFGGWDAFGPPRRISGSLGNVLRELDGRPALDLYERYLGEEAQGLPGTALLYPLRIWPPGRPEQAVVRTVLAIDRAERTMTFAGDLPLGWAAQLMRGHHEHLVAGAEGAATAAREGLSGPVAGEVFGLLVSCVGRRLLMGQRTSDEAEAVHAALGGHCRTIGFYSYGELAPSVPGGPCELHNQTMSVTLIAEAAA